jgi:uncharacterized protein YcfJ
MIGKIATALIGNKLAKSNLGPRAGVSGAVAGAALPVLLNRVGRRMGPMGWVAAAAGGYAAKKIYDRYQARRSVTRVG